MFCKWYGIGIHTFKAWHDRFLKDGERGLDDKRLGRGGRLPVIVPEDVKAEIIRIKLENPGIGGHKIADWLVRNKFIRIGIKKIMEILRENPQTAGIIQPRKALLRGNSGKELQHFERSKPGEMYQMDIMTYMLQGLYRVYVIGCLDDYSRFIVGIGLFRRQTTDRCLDVLRSAIEKYGMPKEMLTDNGRQFYTWRGRSEFQKYLVKCGIEHFRSRPYHPQTLGKIESLWRNMYQELLSKEPMKSFEDAEEKLKKWVEWYNFKRPHQGIGGLVPADRFFGVDRTVRDVMEKGASIVKESLIIDPRQVKEPVYLIGKVDGKEIRIIAKEGSVTVDGPPKLPENIPQEEKHADDSGTGRQEQRTGGEQTDRGQAAQADPGQDKVQDTDGSAERGEERKPGGGGDECVQGGGMDVEKDNGHGDGKGSDA
jgi:transposase InsO family protein